MKLILVASTAIFLREFGMAISGYMDGKFKPAIWDQTGTSKECAVSVKIFTKAQEEIKVPCVIQVSRYVLSLTIKAVDGPLPSVDSDKVGLDFFVGDSVKKAKPVDSLPNLRVKKLSFQATADAITGEFNFKVGEGFNTTRNGLLHIALRLDQYVVKFLVCHVAVFTNHSQISPSYNLGIQDNGQKKLTPCFWFKDAIFVTQKEVLAEKKKKVAELQEEAIPKEKKPLLSIMRALEVGQKAIKKMASDDEEYDEKQLETTLATMVAAISQHLQQPQNILPAPLCASPEATLPALPEYVDYTLAFREDEFDLSW